MPSSATALLLDDDPGVLLALGAILEDRGFRVLESVDEMSAAAHCKNHPGQIDVLIADIILRYSDGRTVVQRIKYLQPNMRLLFISGFALEDLATRGLLDPEDLAPGVAEFLQKPFTKEELLARVDNLLKYSA